MKKFLLSLLFCMFIMGISQVSLAVCDNCKWGMHNDCGRGSVWVTTATQHNLKCRCCGIRYWLWRDHAWNSPAKPCTDAKKCLVCKYSAGTVAHSYTVSCSEAHCSKKKCKWCGKHNGDCGGGHSYKTCSHCKKKYCRKCTKHEAKKTCPCNEKGKCTINLHCKDVTWCTMCNPKHTHVPCNSDGRCDKPHCGREMCSVCKAHECIGGHEYEWVANDKNIQNQTHYKKCRIEGCNYPDTIEQQHGSLWYAADKTHTSKCKNCDLTYTHKPEWEAKEWAQNQTKEPHPCIWSNGNCSATHDPDWGKYYKLNIGENGGDGEEEDEGQHLRKCKVCGGTEEPHDFKGNYKWQDSAKHKKTCTYSGCGLTATKAHRYTKVEKKYYKDTDEYEDNDELHKHWKICVDCEGYQKKRNVNDEEHTDDGHGICSNSGCRQVLWKMIDANGGDITKSIREKETRRAVREEVIRILEVVTVDGKRQEQYIQTLEEIQEVDGKIKTLSTLRAVDNKLTITKNGEYRFKTGRGGWVRFTISNISREIIIDKIIEPMTATTGSVKLILRSNIAETKFDKEIYIVEGEKAEGSIPLSDIKTKGDNPFILKTDANGDGNKNEEYVEITQNGTYKFTAVDTAGNHIIIPIEIDNIVKGQTTAAVSYDVFANGYIYTEILINPDKEWKLNTAKMHEKVKATVYYEKGGANALGQTNIVYDSIMDMRRNTANLNENGVYNPGAYYIRVGIGGSAFNKLGTYIVDLENVILDKDGNTLELDGMNRINVEVQELKDLT